MTDMTVDPLVAALETLTVPAPQDLFHKVAARWVRVDGPLGDLYVAFTDRGVSFVTTATGPAPRAAGPSGTGRAAAAGQGPGGNGSVEAEFLAEFRERFDRPLLPARRPPAGVLSALRTGKRSGVQFDLRGLTPFAQAVLRATASIPKGQVRPYGWVAKQIGHPKAVRAVGTALGNNPVPVLVPCHRVVRADGQIGNFGMGPEVKRRLLVGEGANVDEIAELARHGVHYVASGTTGIVCFPSCADAKRVRPGHRMLYGTVGEAVADGFRPCLHCQPGGGQSR